MRFQVVLGSFLLLAGCSGSGQTSGEGELVVRLADLVKVTYIRFNFDQKKKRHYPVYQVLLSKSWKRKFGNNPQEPYSKLFPRRGRHTPYTGVVPDREMRSFRRALAGKGLSGLVDVPPEEVDLVSLSQVRLNPKEAPFTRIITVGTSKGSRSWVFRNNNYSMESIRQFVQCEKLILRMVSLYATQISVESLPVRPGKR